MKIFLDNCETTAEYRCDRNRIEAPLAHGEMEVCTDNTKRVVTIHVTTKASDDVLFDFTNMDLEVTTMQINNYDNF